MKKDFELVYKSGPHGDQCTSYSIKFNKPITLSEFLSQLDSNEWGSVEARTINTSKVSGYDKIKIVYHNGTITEISPFADPYMNAIIKSGSANGGWSSMNYYLELCQN